MINLAKTCGNTNFLTVTCVLLVLFHCGINEVVGKGQLNFGYTGELGPSHWGDNYGSCVGKHQSPINIDEHDVRNVSFSPLIFGGLDSPRDMTLVNNGHTAQLLLKNSSEPAHIIGGPLDGTYVFEQLHFHWGENDKEGSEDLIGNHSFAMELHVVFYKKEYGSMDEAVKNPDGLAVLAFFFEVDPENKGNPTFDEIVNSLEKIEEVDSEVVLESVNLKNLIEPEDLADDRLQEYFTYNGSLTTPPCSEVVTWIDFDEPLYLSHDQIAAFRDLKSSEGEKLTHNFRPVQPLEDRHVLRNNPVKKMEGAIAKYSNNETDPEVTTEDAAGSASPIIKDFNFVLTLTGLFAYTLLSY